MKGKIGAVVAGVIIFGAVILGFTCREKIPAGYVGIVYNMHSGVAGEVLDQGVHIVPPTKKITTYSVGIEQSYLTAEEKGDSPKDESFSTPTADGKSLRVNLEFSYKFDRERIAETFVQFKGQSGESIKNSFIKPKVQAWTQEVTAKYPVTDVFGDKRQELNEALDVYLKEKFAPYGIIIDTVNFTDISTDSETTAAIQKKVNAQQAQELAKIEAQTAKVQAEKDKQVALIAAEQEKEKAAIVAEQKRIAAEGDAEATRIKAQAEAEANKLRADSLTSELIEYQTIQKWSGNYPNNYVAGSNAIPIIKVGE